MSDSRCEIRCTKCITTWVVLSFLILCKAASLLNADALWHKAVCKPNHFRFGPILTRNVAKFWTVH